MRREDKISARGDGLQLGLAAAAQADETTLIFATTDPGTIELNTRLLPSLGRSR